MASYVSAGLWLRKLPHYSCQESRSHSYASSDDGQTSRCHDCHWIGRKILQILAQSQLKRETWWAGVAMAAMTCGTQSGGVGFSSATRTTRVVATGCAFTATYAYAVISTLPLAGCTILVQPRSLGHNLARQLLWAFTYAASLGI